MASQQPQPCISEPKPDQPFFAFGGDEEQENHHKESWSPYMISPASDPERNWVLLQPTTLSIRSRPPLLPPISDLTNAPSLPTTLQHLQYASRVSSKQLTPSPIPNPTQNIFSYTAHQPATMSNHSNPPEHFTSPLPSPELPIRLPAQTPIFSQLDARPQPSHLQSTNPDSRSPIEQDAYKKLEAHVATRLPYVELASKRLQAITGIRNDTPFELPCSLGADISPASLRSKHLLVENGGEFQTGMLPALAPPIRPAAAPTKTSKRRDSGIGMDTTPPMQRALPMVDEATGKGLREFLLQKGLRRGQTRLDCSSMTFYDFTPDLRTGEFKNELLVHYSNESVHERIVCYQVDLPTANTTTPSDQLHGTERWIWFLLSRPLISYQDPLPPNTKSTSNHTPPNCPSRSYWVVIAAPLSHVTSYVPTSEHINKPAQQPSTGPHAKRITRRRDFDFSHSGVPLFEFSSESDPTFADGVPFLSVEKMASWGVAAAEEHGAYTVEEYAGMCARWVRSDAAWDAESGERKKDMRGKAEQPAAAKGRWWSEFYAKMYEDSRRWGRIRAAMARGKCRVVMRWEEMEELPRGRERERDGERERSLVRRLSRTGLRKRSALAEMTDLASLGDEGWVQLDEMGAGKGDEGLDEKIRRGQ
ncbi:hypothetical protein BP5796_08909 [Coleophoma crateriformis]|uniref:Uncharacterized protein n=1 Tax=Coleophoma crateriformis TaxID=565419 RepID=A0A3D8R2H2_9HELO|nr:hypothetical protein BP5796_08909 [Coleophoma crateriformis]